MPIIGSAIFGMGYVIRRPTGESSDLRGCADEMENKDFISLLRGFYFPRIDTLLL